MPNQEQGTPRPPRKAEQGVGNKNRGRLKIFFGYAPGAGKTHAMLKAAREAKQQGIDVVIGTVRMGAGSQIQGLLYGLERLPNRTPVMNSDASYELDIDAALFRAPQLLIVDELAYANAKGGRHAKRYQDVEELLDAGIDVYTTVNVQHIESLNDMVASVIGRKEQERIPDTVFDGAYQVEFIDIEPQELIERFHEEKGEFGRQSEAGLYTDEKLNALRAIALQRCADRLNLLSQNARDRERGSLHTEEHVLVCLTPEPVNEKLIRAAARISNAVHGVFTALFVETPDFSSMSAEDKNRLHENIRLARQLGAKIETVYGDDLPFQLAEFVRRSGVSKLVLANSQAVRKPLFGNPSLAEKLIAAVPELELHIVSEPTVSGPGHYMAGRRKRKTAALSVADLLKSIGILTAASLIGVVFDRLHFTEVNIITVYILGVLVISVITTNRVYSLVSSIISVFIFNFLFTEPRYTLLAYDNSYPITFLVMFLASFITSGLAVKLKNNARQSSQAAFRTRVLFETNQLLQQAKEPDEIAGTTAKQLIKLLGRDIIVYPAEGDALGEPRIYPAAGPVDRMCLSDAEKAAAGWVLKNNKPAGAATDTLSESKCLYLPIHVNENIYGVVGIAVGENAIDAFENSILLSILGESALAIENQKNAAEKEEAAILAKNEQLRANLLRTISHDLRTPLTSISGNASNLLFNGENFDADTKRQLYSDIYDDSIWLINLVENLLSVTRLEEGRMNLHISAELVDDVITEALRHVNRRSSEHQISVRHEKELLLARMDARLIMQVILNIVDNAIKYTPKDSRILIETAQEGDQAVIRVSDDGPGIPDEIKAHVFDMFYTGANKVADSRRGMGLGLALCRSIIAAHGGQIWVEDNSPHGTRFTFTLPAEEAYLHE